MVQMLQAIPKDSPAFNVILLAMFQNSSIHNRDQIVNALMQGGEANPQMDQMQQMGMELEMQQLQANVQKTLAEAEEEKGQEGRCPENLVDCHLQTHIRRSRDWQGINEGVQLLEEECEEWCMNCQSEKPESNHAP